MSRPSSGFAWTAFIFGLALGVAGSGVLAVFSDVETSRQSTLQAGSLDLKTDGGDGVTTFIARNVQPCPHPDCQGQGRTPIDNVGSDPGNLSIAVKPGDVTDHPGRTFESEPRPDDGELGETAQMALFLDENDNGVFDIGDVGLSAVPLPASGECLQYEPATFDFDEIRDYEGCTWSDVTTLPPWEQDGFVVRWRVPEDAGGEIMDDQVFVTFTFDLVQLNS